MNPLRRLVPSREAVLSLVAGVAAVAGSYLVAGFTPAYVVAPIDAWLQRAMPGVVVTFAIETLGSLGQQLNLLTATALVAFAFASVARLTFYVGEGLRSHTVPIVLTGAFSWALALLLTGALVAATAAGLAAAGTLAVARLVDAIPRIPRAGTDTTDTVDPSDATNTVDPSDGTDTADTSDATDDDRRAILAALGLAGGVGVLSVLRNGLPVSSTIDDEDSRPEDISEEAREQLDVARDRSLDVSGIEPLVSEDFYNVDINSIDPDVDADEWSLSITGAVEEELTFDMDDIRAMDSRRDFVTLRCVGEALNGHKMDTALWTGVDAMTLVERAGIQSDCNCVMFRAHDDYFEEFPLEALEQGMFAYEMNGAPLPRSHGYPLRALVYGHWGEINVKWLTEIELLEREQDGYWEQRGWHGTGPVHTVAKLHAVNDLEDGRKQVAGHAYAGTRGVSGVEVSIDGGETWQDARLSEPLPGADVWRQWAFEYDHPGSQHEVVVRAIEADGTVQPSEEMDSFPNGPMGWVSRTVN